MIHLASVRELIAVILDELLVPVDKVIFGEVCPRSIRRSARYTRSHIPGVEEDV